MDGTGAGSSYCENGSGSVSSPENVSSPDGTGMEDGGPSPVSGGGDGGSSSIAGS